MRYGDSCVPYAICFTRRPPGRARLVRVSACPYDVAMRRPTLLVVIAAVMACVASAAVLGPASHASTALGAAVPAPPNGTAVLHLQAADDSPTDDAPPGDADNDDDDIPTWLIVVIVAIILLGLVAGWVLGGRRGLS